MSEQVSKVKFFAPDASVLGSLTDWELQSGGSPSVSRQRAQALKANGDELKAAQYDAKVEYSLNYKPSRYSGDDGLTIPPVGKILNGAHVDSVSLTYSQTDFPVLAVTAHRHAAVDGTPATHGPCRVYPTAVVLPPRTIGVPSSLKDSAGKPIFTCPAGIGMRSIAYSLSATHLDELDGGGAHLAGQNRDGVETLTIEFTGEVAISELAIDSGWALPDSSSVAQSNEAATTTSVTIQRHLAYSTTDTPDGAEN